ncbi:hypothetical protein [Devriesea agamarum]|uniref:hypothetical protein n=1 Tax=Devriesea agamarum TaxID=472569 RepID=UPI0012ED106F|nr:hypothetical protein [Devriesea agamarum]
MTKRQRAGGVLSRRSVLAVAGSIAAAAGIYSLDAYTRRRAGDVHDSTPDRPSAEGHGDRKPYGAGKSHLALWGSSSMAGGLAHEGLPRPVTISHVLSNTLPSLTVKNYAVGGQWSRHAAMLRGASSARFRFPRGQVPSFGRVRVEQVGGELPWDHRFDAPVTVAGVRGRLTCQRPRLWIFERTQPGDPVPEDAVCCDLAKESGPQWGHIVWTGKNNDFEPDRVISDIESIRRVGMEDKQDTLVLGMWQTRRDQPDRIARNREINKWQESRYGRRFLDMQEALTEGVSQSARVYGVGYLLDRSDVRRDLAEGRVPTPLIGSDGMHLNALGNLVAGHAVRERIHELGWVSANTSAVSSVHLDAMQ